MRMSVTLTAAEAAAAGALGAGGAHSALADAAMERKDATAGVREWAVCEARRCCTREAAGSMRAMVRMRSYSVVRVAPAASRRAVRWLCNASREDS